MAITSYVVLLLSISVHESAHAWTALRMGDDTGQRQGRISLNPIVHIDLFGTVIIPLVQMLGVGIPLLGWAKPTPVSPRNFRSIRKGYILTWGAGPISNFLLALLFTAALFVAVRVGVDPSLRQPLFHFLLIGVSMNVGLGVFNLIPLPPLDGSFVLSWVLPRHMGDAFDRVMQHYGNMILMVLFITGILGRLVAPFIQTMETFLFSLVT
jgi:Zn-dependent protease